MRLRLQDLLIAVILGTAVPALAQTEDQPVDADDAAGAGRQEQVVFAPEEEVVIPEWPSPIAFSWPIRSEAECKGQLGEFQWLCKVLEKGADYESLYEKSYWELVFVRAFIDDLDGDGLPDLIYEQQGGGNCGSQGCHYSFVFGGHPQFDHAWPFSIQAALDPAIVPEQDEFGLRFAPEGAFWPIAAIKAEALRTIEAGGPLELPGIEIPVPEDETVPEETAGEETDGSDTVGTDSVDAASEDAENAEGTQSADQ
ncbi:MAG: hypothetical protein AAF666_06735 [Pseudomonadota bacterium]